MSKLNILYQNIGILYRILMKTKRHMTELTNSKYRHIIQNTDENKKAYDRIDQLRHL